MIIGKMDRLLTFKTIAARTQNAYGQALESSGSTTQRWCAVNYLAGKKGFETEALIAEKPVEIMTRYDSSINTDNEITLDGTTHYITSIQIINRNAGLRILAKAQPTQ
jgi:SPP1 family predicted phage head-tail adaptor